MFEDEDLAEKLIRQEFAKRELERRKFNKKEVSAFKTHEIEGFNTELLKKGLAIRLVRHSIRLRNKEMGYLYFIKDIKINEIELIDYCGKVKILHSDCFIFNDTLDGYYEIVEILW